MSQKKYDAFILFNSDAHKNEYLAEIFQKIKHLTKFSGSNATAVVTSDQAKLWTDSRYYIQAEKQLDSSHWEMVPLENRQKNLVNFLSTLPTTSKIAFDFKSCSVCFAENLKKKLPYNEFVNDPEIINNALKVTSNQINQDPEKSAVFIHDVKYSGKTTKEKLRLLRKQAEAMFGSGLYNVDTSREYCLIINKLDDIACKISVK